MTWTYSGNPSSSARDAIRFEVGDTDTTDQLLSDEEIAYVIAIYGGSYEGASNAAMAIAAKFARLMSRSIGGLSADFAAKYQHYTELAENLMKKAKMFPPSPYGSGWSRSQKETVSGDDDREPTFSEKGIHDNRRYAPADAYEPYRSYY
jgi:hypothetical protein